MAKEHTNKTSGMITAGFVLGIIGLALSPIPIINNLAFVIAIIALVFGLVGLRQTKGGQKPGRNKAVVAVALGAAGLALVLITQNAYSTAIDKVSDDINKASNQASEQIDKATGKKTDELLKTDVQVTFGTFVSTTKDYMTTTKLPVTVTNKNTERKTYSITVEAVDASGARIAEDTIYVNDLGSGQSQSLDAFQYVTSDKVAALKTATFKVVTVSQS